MSKFNSKVLCKNRGWIIGVGKHHNLLVSFNKYPLIVDLDLNDLDAYDFRCLESFFKSRQCESVVSCGKGRWTLSLDKHYNFSIEFAYFPGRGSLCLGELSLENSKRIGEMLKKTQPLGY